MQVGTATGEGIDFIVAKLQWGKDDFGFSLHASPNRYTSYGIQLTDFLSYLDFQRGQCTFFQGSECFSIWVNDDFEIQKFAKAFSASFNEIENAEKKLRLCGFFLKQPEGWGYFTGKSRQNIQHGYPMSHPGDGHTSPKTDILKTTEDEYLKFVLSWIVGGNAKGWTFHYRPKHQPLSPEFGSVIKYLNLNSFEDCPCFDFDPCYWRFMPFEESGDSIFNSNAELANKWFDAHPQNFSEGIKALLLSQSLIDPFHMKFLPIRQEESVRIESQIERNIKRSEQKSKTTEKQFDFDVSISFAGTERKLAEELANLVREAGFDVFYDDFYPEQLWGRDLIVLFDEIYRKRSKYCVVFVSEEYCKRMWTIHERKSAQARSLEERGEEYILPIMIDATELPGMPPTTGYLSLEKLGIQKIGELLIKKLGK